MSDSTDLLIRETLLGVIKAKDVKGNKLIHSSDFKKAISDLGLPWGSPVVDSIMMYCKTDSNGNINITPLETQLQKERDDYNSRRERETQKPPKVSSTSVGTKSAPFRVDVANKLKFEAEKQKRLIKEYREQVLKIYSDFSNHNANVDATVSSLSAYGIFPTKAFVFLLKQRLHDDLTLADFVRALSINDPPPDLSTVAGAVKGEYRQLETDEGTSRL